MSVITYSDRSAAHFQLNSYTTKPEVMAAILSAPYFPGRANLASAFREIRRLTFTKARGDRPDVPNAAVIFTSSKSNLYSRWTIPAANSVRRRGVEIYAVATDLDDKSELSRVVSRPTSKHLFSVDDPSELDSIKEDLTRAVFGGEKNVMSTKFCSNNSDNNCCNDKDNNNNNNNETMILK